MRDKVSHHQLFYFPPDSRDGDLVVFPKDESAHMVKSLRLAQGEVVKATDGVGNLYEARLEGATRGLMRARVLAVTQVPPPRPSVSIFQGIVRLQRMDWLVEKAVELGMCDFVPVECARCLRGIAGPRLLRWRRIAREAMKQSLRAHLPRVGEPESFARALEGLGDFELVLMASGKPGDERLAEMVGTGASRIALWVGPEGGFADGEARALGAAGAKSFSLGPHRLRSETAALAALAVVCQHGR